MVYDPSMRLHYPLPHHRDDKRRIPKGILKDLIRKFSLPEDIFD
jgi:hypothetical protein